MRKGGEVPELFENKLSYVGQRSFLNTFYFIDTKLYPVKTILEVIFMTTILLFWVMYFFSSNCMKFFKMSPDQKGFILIEILKNRVFWKFFVTPQTPLYKKDMFINKKLPF